MMDIVWTEFESLPSTSAWVKENASSLPGDKISVVSAKVQTKGYGQRGRVWTSKEGNIALTLAIPLHLKQSSGITLMFALCIVEFFEAHGISMQIKWPNDLILDGGKIGGALGELVSHKENIFLVLGFGFNVSMEKDALNQIDQEANSLENHTKKKWDTHSLAKELINHFVKHLGSFLDKGLAPFKDQIEKRLLYINEKVHFDLDGKIIEGVLKGITPDGHLILNVNGEDKVYPSGRIQRT